MFRATTTAPWPFFRSARTGSNLSSRTHSSSAFSRRNLIRRNSASPGRTARSRAALASVIRESSASRPALAWMPSTISTSPTSSGPSRSTIHVEKTAAAPSTSNSTGVGKHLDPRFVGRDVDRVGARRSRSANARCGRSGRGRSRSSASGIGSSRMGIVSCSVSISSMRPSIVAMTPNGYTLRWLSLKGPSKKSSVGPDCWISPAVTFSKRDSRWSLLLAQMVRYNPRWLSLKGNFNSGQTRELLSHRPIRTAPRSMVPAPTEPLLVIGPYTAAPAGSGEWALAESHQMNSTEARKTAFAAELRWAQGQPFACVATLGHVVCSNIPAVATSLKSCTPRPARVGPPQGPQARLRKSNAKARCRAAGGWGRAFDPLSGAGILRGNINWCVHPPCPPGRRGWRGLSPGPQARLMQSTRKPDAPSAEQRGHFRPASRYGYIPRRH